MKTKLIFSIVTCVMCFCVSMLSSVAWFTIEEQSRAEGFNSEIYNKEFVYELFVYDDAWKDSQTITLDSFNPGYVYYFKLTIKNTSLGDIVVKAGLDGYSSIVSSEIQYDSQNNIIYTTDRENNIHSLYDVDSEGLVKVGDNVLYDCTDNVSPKLADYKIEDVVKLYSLTGNDNPLLATQTEITLSSNFIENITLTPNEEVSIYFAFEFVSTENDNYYQYQTFNVSGLKISIL